AFNLSSEIFQIVPADPKQHWFRACGNHLRMKRVAVAVSDLFVPGRLGHFNQFVSRSKNCNARPAGHEDFSFSKAGKGADVCDLNALARGHDSLTGPQFGRTTK